MGTRLESLRTQIGPNVQMMTQRKAKMADSTTVLTLHSWAVFVLRHNQFCTTRETESAKDQMVPIHSITFSSLARSVDQSFPVFLHRAIPRHCY